MLFVLISSCANAMFVGVCPCPCARVRVLVCGALGPCSHGVLWCSRARAFVVRSARTHAWCVFVVPSA